MRCVNLLQFYTRWFYWFRFSTLCNLRNLGNLSQTIARRLSNVGAFCPTRATGKTCYDVLHHKSSFINVSQHYPTWFIFSIRAILNNFNIWVRFCQMNHFYKIDSAREPIFSKSLQVVPTCKPCQTVSHLRRFARYSQTLNQNCAICARDEKWISLCQLIHFGTPY